MKILILLSAFLTCTHLTAFINPLTNYYLKETAKTTEELSEYVDQIIINTGSSYGITSNGWLAIWNHCDYSSYPKALHAMQRHNSKRFWASLHMALGSMFTGLFTGICIGGVVPIPVKNPKEPNAAIALGMFGTSFLVGVFDYFQHRSSKDIPYYTNMLEQCKSLSKDSAIRNAIISTCMVFIGFCAVLSNRVDENHRNYC